jgi:putative lipoic acid-binding regulatory protein
VTEPLADGFPCDFPIKVLGRRDAGLERAATEIIERHTGPIEPHRSSVRPSKDGNFVALTVTVVARSRAQLDELYRELTACEAVLMTL